jgi:hypothetical protein
LCHNGVMDHSINTLASLFTEMKPTDFPVSDIEKFAEYMGLDGIDSDLFYESYYQLDECDSYELEWGESEVYASRNYESIA